MVKTAGQTMNLHTFRTAPVNQEIIDNDAQEQCSQHGDHKLETVFLTFPVV